MNASFLSISLRSTVGLLASLLVLFSTAYDASAFNWHAVREVNRTTVLLFLDSADQIAHLRKTSPTEIVLPLQKPLATKNFSWVTSNPDDLIHTCTLTSRNLKFKLAPTVQAIRLQKTAPKIMTLIFERAKRPVAQKTPHPRSLYLDTPPQAQRRSHALRFAKRPEPASDLLFRPQKRDYAAVLAPSAGDETEVDDEHRWQAKEIRASLSGKDAVPYSTLQKMLNKTAPTSPQKHSQNRATREQRTLFFAESSSSQAQASDRAIFIKPQDIRAKINTSGPEDWPESESFTSSVPQGPQANTEPTGAPANDGIAHGHVIPGSIEEQPRTQPQTPSPDPSIGRGHVTPAAKDVPVQNQRFPVNMEPVKQAAPEKNNQPPRTNIAQPAKPQPQKPEPAKEQPKPGQTSVHGQANLDREGLVIEKPKEEGEEQEKPKERQVLYVDENGNPVEKPVDIPAVLKDIEQFLEEKKYDDALLTIQKLRENPRLNAEQLERLLYLTSDCYWAHYENHLNDGYEDIVSSTNEALNNNLRSPRVPEALLRLCLVNIGVENVTDARAYCDALFRRFPSFPGCAVAFTALGKLQLQKNFAADAERSFTMVLDKYPESNQLKQASVGLVRTCVQLQKFDRARLILDFVNKRWPRHFVDEPKFLLTQAALEKHDQQLDNYLQSIWLYFNLEPKNDQVNLLFVTMGDVYLKGGNNKAANFLYQWVVDNAPESKEALTAKIRLTEQGIFESPLSKEALFAIFGRGAKPSFWQTYNEVANASNTQSDAILARLKLALWLLWDKQYPEAMGKAADFIDEYPEQPDKKLAEDIIWAAFQEELNTSLAEQNYGRLLSLWNGFPLVRKRYGEVDAKLRFALAQGQKERGDEEGALKLLRSFLNSPMDPEYGETAFLDFFNKYLREKDWERMLDLGRTVASWKLSPMVANDLDYAMALAAQNLNLRGTALDLWQKIAAKEDCPLYQKAWATVFLAQDAERRKDIREAYAYNTDVVKLFTLLQEERSDKADPERIKTAMNSLMDICEVSNHLPEALQWVNRYRNFVTEQSAEYPALRYRESRLYRKLGDSNRAQALLEEIVRQHPESPYAKAAQSELQTFEISRDLQNFQSSS